MAETIGQWLRLVAERAQPLLDQGLGLVACRARLTDEALVIDELCFVGCPAEASSWQLVANGARPGVAGPGIVDRTLVEIEGPGVDGCALYLIAPSASAVNLTPVQRADVVELGSHLSAALSLRALLGGERKSLGEMLPLLREAPARSSVAADAAALLWEALLAGHLSLVAHTERDGRRLVLARHKRFTCANARPLSERERRAAQLAVQGRSTKDVAGKIGVAEVTGAVLIVSAIRRLGLRSRVELAEVNCTQDGARCLAAWRFELGAERYTLFETSLCRLEVPTGLSHAEREVVRGVLGELSNTEIARARRTSMRTVANQLSSVYWKLGISGRAELIEACAG